MGRWRLPSADDESGGGVTEDGQRCQTCRGTGEHLYGNTAMGMGGPAGQAFTVGPCPGTRHRPDLTDCPVVLAMIAERGVWEPRDG